MHIIIKSIHYLSIIFSLIDASHTLNFGRSPQSIYETDIALLSFKDGVEKVNVFDLEEFPFFKNRFLKNEFTFVFEENYSCEFKRILEFKQKREFKECFLLFEYIGSESFLKFYAKFYITEVRLQADIKLKFVKEIEQCIEDIRKELPDYLNEEFVDCCNAGKNNFSLNHFLIASLVLPVVLECGNAVLLIKYDLDEEIYSLKSFGDVKCIYIEISNYGNRLVDLSLHDKTSKFFDLVISGIQKFYPNVPMHVSLFSRYNEDDMFLNYMYMYLEKKNCTFKMLKKINDLNRNPEVDLRSKNYISYNIIFEPKKFKVISTDNLPCDFTQIYYYTLIYFEIEDRKKEEKERKERKERREKKARKKEEKERKEREERREKKARKKEEKERKEREEIRERKAKKMKKN